MACAAFMIVESSQGRLPVQEVIDQFFWICVEVLRVIGDVTGMGYNLANILIFVIIQPSLIALFFFLWRHEKQKNRARR